MLATIARGRKAVTKKPIGQGEALFVVRTRTRSGRDAIVLASPAGLSDIEHDPRVEIVSVLAHPFDAHDLEKARRKAAARVRYPATAPAEFLLADLALR